MIIFEALMMIISSIVGAVGIYFSLSGAFGEKEGAFIMATCVLLLIWTYYSYKKIRKVKRS